MQNGRDIPQILEEAFQLAVSGRPGPVLIDIPMDVQRELIDVYIPTKRSVEKIGISVFPELTQLAAAIRQSKRPLILAGRGVLAAFAKKELAEFLALTKIPVVTSLLAIDAVDFSHSQRVGFIGSYGNRWANIALGECDLLIVLGSRLDIRQTGADTEFFSKRVIYHVDCEEGEINNRVQGCIPVVADVKQFLEAFNKFFSDVVFEQRSEWTKHIEQKKETWPDIKELIPDGINPNLFIHELSKASNLSTVFLADVGSHQMWTAQSLELDKKQAFLTSAGMGAMGFALPASIGACLATGITPVVTIIGDGCMQINIQELQTIVRNELPVKIVVLNNRNLGMIRQFQDSYFESRYQSTWWGYSAPDFQKIAIAYGIDALTIDKESDINNAVKWLWNEERSSKPALLQVMIDPLTNTYPKIAFGKPITEMEPFSKPVDMEST